MDATDAWFSQAYPDGRGLEDFPSRQADLWTVRRSDVEKAITVASRSAPGPDGIPYKVWQSLGDVAVEVIWRTAQELQLPDAGARIERAYHDEGTCGFNSGLLGFLPKKPTRHD